MLREGRCDRLCQRQFGFWHGDFVGIQRGQLKPSAFLLDVAADQNGSSIRVRFNRKGGTDYVFQATHDLYLGNELPPEVMDYVIQTCARVQHELTILTFETENCARALLEPHQEALEDAGVKVAPTPSDMGTTLQSLL